MKVLLASASPRRKELLQEIIRDFDIKVFPCDESFVGATPEETVLGVAKEKMNAVMNKEDYDLIITCDTLVYMDNKYYGKPTDKNVAFRMLKELSGNVHQVVSGLVVYYKGGVTAHAVTSKVKFKSLTDSEIHSYIDNYNPLDKAGAYAIQDSVVVDSYKGSYNNIVGLPTEKLKEILSTVI